MPNQQPISNDVLLEKLSNIASSLKDLKDNVSETSEQLYKQAASTERIENVLGSNSLNNNKGLVAVVQEHSTEIATIKMFVNNIQEEKSKSEKSRNWGIAIFGIVLTAIQTAIAIIVIKK